MSRPLSPLDRLIDKACGLECQKAYRKAFVQVECPSCPAKRTQLPGDGDPVDLDVVKATCPKCMKAGLPATYRLLRHDGSEIEVHWENLAKTLKP